MNRKVLALTLDASDSVAVLTEDGKAGDVLEGHELCLLEDISRGHKVALRQIGKGDSVIKYGSPIGVATSTIEAGEHVHSHNLVTNLSESKSYSYQPNLRELKPSAQLPETVKAYRRADGRLGIRNELWVIPTVGCVNDIAIEIVQRFKREHDFQEVYAFTHPYGCSQLGDDHLMTRTLLQRMATHPNAGGVLVLGLGCENNQLDTFRETLGEYDQRRVRFLISQDHSDEIAVGLTLLQELYTQLKEDKRSDVPLDELIIGLECGGSDAFSGITANPLIGKLSDQLVTAGASVLLTEVPEMFGSEQVLMQQCENEEVFEKTVRMIDSFKEYYISRGQPVYENPSPGNKAGGITSLEEKSLGCTRKAGSSAVVDVLKMGETVREKGLSLLYSPGNDIVATTALGASGCHLVLFSTGRGTPLGGFIPVIKISSTTSLATNKPGWIDFDAGALLVGRQMEELTASLGRLLVETIEGKRTKSEHRSTRTIALFKDGVTL